jgi:hypothetical protein
MSAVVIILGVIVIILIYFLIRVAGSSSTQLTATANLNDDITPIPITNSPRGTKYAYGLWMYVNSWDMGSTKTIFSRADNIALYLDSSSPVLNCNITMSNDTSKTVEITDNFPLQKWVYVIVSVDNQYVDCYLDGKLVKSVRVYIDNETDGIKVPKQPPQGGKDGVKMKLGGTTRYDAYITKFKHWPSSVNPETAWTTYMEGNGQSTFKNWMSSYGLDVLLKKDNVEQTKFSLF